MKDNIRIATEKEATEALQKGKVVNVCPFCNQKHVIHKYPDKLQDMRQAVRVVEMYNGFLTAQNQMVVEACLDRIRKAIDLEEQHLI